MTAAEPARDDAEPNAVRRHRARIDAINAARERQRDLRRQRVRGAALQQPLREIDASLQRRAIAILCLAASHGLTPKRIARAIGVPLALLRRWQRQHELRCQRGRDAGAGPERTCLGRPPLPEPPELVRAMRHLCVLFGPALGARDLHRDFPDASWRTCLALTHACRRELRDQLRDARLRTCTWTTPGTVWAADVWKPDAPVDGEFPYILDVRDLASGHIIASEPLHRADAESVGAVFERLYRHLGAPLVCKTDNGSEFTGDGAWQVHHRHGVEQLRAPPELPSYNGACEAGHGSIRFRAELLARRDGTPGDWSLNHLAGARDWANDRIDPKTGSCPSRRFDGRLRVSEPQRIAFRQAVLVNRERRVEQLRAAARDGRRAISIDQPGVARWAIAKALRDLDYLTHRSAPIHQPIPWLDASPISL